MTGLEMVECPALAGQAPQLDQRHSKAGYPRATKALVPGTQRGYCANVRR